MINLKNIATDGLANIGVGSLENSKLGSEFYEQIGHFAKKKGVVVSVLSIKGMRTKQTNHNENDKKT